MDPTIPAGRPLLPMNDHGRLVQVSPGDVRLRPEGGGEYPAGTYAVVQLPGVQILPRAWVPDGRGGWLVEGDMVLIAFLHGRQRRPVVAGVIRSTTDTSGLATSPMDATVRDDVRLLLDCINAAGVSPGSIDLRMGADGRPRVELRVSDLVTIAASMTAIHGRGRAEAAALLKQPMIDLLLQVIDDLLTVATAAGAPIPGTVAKKLSLELDQAGGLGQYSTIALQAE